MNAFFKDVEIVDAEFGMHTQPELQILAEEDFNGYLTGRFQSDETPEVLTENCRLVELQIIYDSKYKKNRIESIAEAVLRENDALRKLRNS